MMIGRKSMIYPSTISLKVCSTLKTDLLTEPDSLFSAILIGKGKSAAKNSISLSSETLSSISGFLTRYLIKSKDNEIFFFYNFIFCHFSISFYSVLYTNSTDLISCSAYCRASFRFSIIIGCFSFLSLG